MGKLVKGVVRFSVAAATVAGVCYVFKDKIKQSKFYQEYDVDSKIDKVKTTIKDKIKQGEDETDIIEDDEIIIDGVATVEDERDYVPLDNEASEDASTSEEEKTDNDTSEDEEKQEIPTINV